MHLFGALFTAVRLNFWTLHKNINFLKPIRPIWRKNPRRCRDWTRARASETDVSQSGIEPKTSCTAAKRSKQGALRTVLLTAIRNIVLYYYSSPPHALDWESWLSLTRTQIYLIRHVKVRIAREGAKHSNLYCIRGSRVLEPQNHVRMASHRGHHYVGAWPGPLHPLHRASETDVSLSGIEPRASCTAGEHSMQRAIPTALLTAIQKLSLYYYKGNVL